jgi:hypothetical protein
VAGGCVHAHLREVFLGGTTKAPFLDHLDRRININKARLTINPHQMTKPSLVDRGRKRKQVESAPKKSREAKLVKLADKTSNVRAVANSPAPDWSVERRREYIDWATGRCRFARHIAVAGTAV